MWTDKTLESLIPIAAELLGSSRKVSTYLTLGTRCPDPDADPSEWQSWTPGLRAYAILFNYCSRRDHLDLLYRLAPREVADRLYRQFEDERRMRARDLTREAAWCVAVSRIEGSKARQEQNNVVNPQQRGWTREDVVAEYYDETGDPMLGPPKKKTEPILPSYDNPVAPVRHVSPDEYLATQRKPVYGGVKPEFAKESEHFTKEKPDNADKNVETLDLLELWGVD